MNDQAASESELDPVVERVSSRQSISTVVSSAVAEVKGVDTECLDPLYDTVDLDALNNLFREFTVPEDVDAYVTFVVEDCTVVVYGDGRVVVSPVVDYNAEDTS